MKKTYPIQNGMILDFSVKGIYHESKVGLPREDLEGVAIDFLGIDCCRESTLENTHLFLLNDDEILTGVHGSFPGGGISFLGLTEVRKESVEGASLFISFPHPIEVRCIFHDCENFSRISFLSPSGERLSVWETSKKGTVDESKMDDFFVTWVKAGAEQEASVLSSDAKLSKLNQKKRI